MEAERAARQSSRQLQEDVRDTESASNGKSKDHADVRATAKAEHYIASRLAVSADAESLRDKHATAGMENSVTASSTVIVSKRMILSVANASASLRNQRS